MGVNTAATSTIAIGTTTVCNNQADYEADSYTNVGEASDLGEFGDTAETIQFTALADRRVRKFKGSFDAGTITVQVGADLTDSGQDALVAAFAADDDYNFRIQLNDEATVGGTPTTLYCSGKVTSKNFNVGSVNNVVMRTFTIAVNSAFTVVDPT
jgi:hypothetical protein